MTDHLLLIAGAPVIALGAILVVAARFGAQDGDCGVGVRLVAIRQRLEQDEADDIAA